MASIKGNSKGHGVSKNVSDVPGPGSYSNNEKDGFGKSSVSFKIGEKI